MKKSRCHVIGHGRADLVGNLTEVESLAPLLPGELHVR
jgi:hypothetical protein